MVKLFALTLLILLLPVIASAHHSRAGYDMNSPLEIEGELVGVTWRNPHPGFSVRVPSEVEEDRLWTVEGWGALYHLERTGITGESFNVGDRVRVAGFPSRRKIRQLLGTHVLLTNGTEAILRADTGPRWTQDHIGGEDQWAADETELEGAAAEDKGIFRVWSPSGYARSLSTTTWHLPYTEAAVASRAAWDPDDNFITRCEQPGMPMVMASSVYPHAFENQGTEILLHAQWFDVTRTIHMNPSDRQVEPASSRLGHSIGRWEGRTLVVETTEIDWPYFDAGGTRQSDAIQVREEFTLSEDQTHLDYHMTIVDPETFTEPATVDAYWLALGEEIQRYDCLVQ